MTDIAKNENDIMLEVRELSIQFGGLRAVDELNMKVKKHALYGLIGPNGAGKTTVFNMLTGVYKPRRARYSSTARTSRANPPLKSTKAVSQELSRTFACLRE